MISLIDLANVDMGQFKRGRSARNVRPSRLNHIAASISMANAGKATAVSTTPINESLPGAGVPTSGTRRYSGADRHAGPADHV